MNPMTLRPQPRIASPRESGIALFVVMVVVVVLSVVVFQLAYTTKVEERIAKNGDGLVALRVSLVSVARSTMLTLHTDYQDDLDSAAAEEEAPNPEVGEQAGEGPGNPAGEGIPAEPGAEDSEETEVGTDSRHESWTRPLHESVNGIEVEGHVLDLESGLDLNDIFEYPRLPDDEDGDGEPDDESNEDAAGEDGASDPPGDGEEGEDGEGPSGEEEDEEEAGPLNCPEGDESEWEGPAPEQVEMAELVLTRLIEGIVAYNQEFEFYYQGDVPNADLAAKAIVDWVLLRIEQPETREIRSLAPLKRLEDVGWELYDGPPLPEELLEEQQEGLEELEELGPLAGFSEYLEGGGLGLEGFIEREDGVDAEPRPLGLRHVLNARSSGKLNLNTARPEVIAALLVSYDDLDEALGIALEIESFLNSYVSEDETDGETVGEEAGEDDSEETGEEDSQEFNVFTKMDDLKRVNEEWDEDDGSGSDNEDTTFSRIQKDLGRISVFRSTHFVAQLKGTREDQTVEGELVLERAKGKIRVFSWREVTR